MVILSVLDQSPVPSGSSAQDAIANSVDLAQRCEALGYSRYWLAEHHGTYGLAGSAPELLIAHIAAKTTTIRVGSGGVMLPHYSALKVAELFRVLATMHPDRIDLGLGRAPGGTPLATLALQRNRQHPAGDDFLEQLAELRAWLADDFPENHPFAKQPATPVPETSPELWLLSSSGYSAQAAAHFGTGLCFAHFINAHGGPEAMAYYREHFAHYRNEDVARTAIAVRVIVADTNEEAEHLGASMDLWRLRQRRYGEHGAVPTPEEALAHSYTDADLSVVIDSRSRAIAGDQERVHATLTELARDYGVDEIVAVTITHDHRARVRSYELLAQAFGLSSAKERNVAHSGVQLV
ncbi:MAG TPA: LLM class flavin-dependent oxidoreductase [Acidimicrobiales bacterium]|nr:LLM class flavin-dependent oxidoreductase [Acidimicrobiales bacterium]